MDKKAPRKVPTQERARATVLAILSATERLALEQGVEAVTMLDVATLAGVSSGTLYQYYAGLEPLLAAWEEARFEEMAMVLVARLQETASTAPPPDQSIAELVGLGFDLVMKHMGYFRKVDKAELTSRVVARVRIGGGVIDSFSQIFASGPHRARWRDGDRRAAARLVVVTVFWTAYTAYSSRQPPEAVAVIRRELQTMVVSYLLRDV